MTNLGCLGVGDDGVLSRDVVEIVDGLRDDVVRALTNRVFRNKKMR